jgi:ribonuclease E
MAKELIINASLPEVRIALMDDGRIQELLIERQSEKGIVGNIYKGRVTRVLPGMQAAFVDIGLDKAAFLYVDDIYVHPKVMGDDTDFNDHDHGEEEGEEAPQRQQNNRQGRGRHQQQAQAPRDPNAPKIIIQPRATPLITSPVDGSVEAGAEAANEAENREGNGEITAEENASEGLELSPDHGVVDQFVDSSNLESHVSEHIESDNTIDEDEEFLEEDEEESYETSGEDSDENGEDESSEAEDDSEDSSEQSENTFQASGEEGSGEHTGSENAGEISRNEGSENGEEVVAQTNADGSPFIAPLQGLVQEGGKRGRGRNQRNRRRGRGGQDKAPRHQFGQAMQEGVDPNLMPETLSEHLFDKGNVESDRAQVEDELKAAPVPARPAPQQPKEFREPRNRDRRIKSKHSKPRAQAQIGDLLKEGQEVIVQVAKDPIATKGARLTCHVSLPGRHLVCMPTIDHVGVSRRIERDDERRRLRDFVERNRPRKMGFIVRTASGGKDPESWIKQDIDYLSKLWTKIKTRADEVSAPALAYEDLNSVLRAIRDWVNEDIDKIIVDSRYHYNELMDFADRFMPALLEKIELYQGDIPIFDAYGLSSELHRSLERRVWLKSGGYIVIDQAEALVAIDVNTGRFVGKKNLEDTILKTNMEAADEIAYQLRLRNCGGIVIVDFIDMEREENKLRVYRALDEALKKDRARPTIQKISDLGLVEMTRKRTRDTIIRSLCEPCDHCEGKGFTKSVKTVAYEILREIERLSVDREAKKILVSAHEAVVDLLAIELRDVVDALERRYNKQVYLQTILDYHSEQFEVVTDRMPGKKRDQDIARQLRIERDRSERKEKQKVRQKEIPQRFGRDDEEENGSEEQSAHETAFSQAYEEAPESAYSESARSSTEDSSEGSAAGETDVVNAAPRATFKINPVAPGSQPAQQPRNQNRNQGRNQNRDRNQNPNQNQGPIPNQNFEPGNMAPLPPQGGVNANGEPDEDQLAYLRAQAAQDAALASFGGGANGNQAQNAGNQGRNNNGRNQNNRGGGRNQNNQNRNNGGGRGRNDQQRNANGGGQGGNNRFRHRNPQGFSQNQGNGNAGITPNYGNGEGESIGNSGPISSPPPAPTSTETHHVPDYEVLVKSNGDSNS